MEIKVTCDIQNRVDYKSLVPTQGELKSLSKENYNRFKKSVIKYGIHSPCAVWNNSGILQTLDGHQRCLGFGKMESEGYKIPLIPIYTIDAPDLKTAKEILLTLVSQYGHIEGQGLYEFTTLAGLDLEFLKDMTDLPGLDLNKYEAEFYKDLTKGQCDEDEVPEKVEPKTKLGDLYVLGDHRLLCGDSTDINQVEKLMNGEKADMVFTDPPYGIEYDDTKYKNTEILGSKYWGANIPVNNFNQIKNDNIEFDPLFILSFYSYCREIFIWGANEFAFRLPKGTWIMWTKKNENQSNLLGGDFEVCWSKNKHGMKNYFKMWTGFVNKEKNEKRMHPTQKPIELIERILDDFLNGNIVIDLFGGSGSTLIACEKTNRKCFMMELDPHYCSVIIERWRKYTGKEAYRVEPNGDQTPWSKITI